MKTILLLMFAFGLQAQTPKPSDTQKPLEPTKATTPLPKPPISHETMLELQLLEQKEAPLREAFQKIAEALNQIYQPQRNEVVNKECSKYGLDAAKGECGLDLKSGTMEFRIAPKIDTITSSKK